MGDEVRLSRIEEDVRDHKSSLEELHNRLDIHSEAIQSLEQWRKGNGAMGAEARLQCVEAITIDTDKARLPQRVAEMEADVQAIKAVTDNALRDRIHESVTHTLDARERRFMARLKAWSPLIVAVVTLVGVVIAAIFRVQL